MRAGELAPNPANWRRHPPSQRAALRALLRQIGYADALLARRLDPDQVVPVLVVDVTAEEADTLLATLDPLAALARPDAPALAALLERVTGVPVRPAAVGAGAERDHVLRFWDLVVDPLQRGGHLVGEGAGDH